MRTLKLVLADIEAKANASKALFDKGADATAEDLESVRKFAAEIAELETEAEAVKQFEAEKAANEKRLADLAKVETFSVPTTTEEKKEVKTFAVPRSHATSFSGSNSEEKAYRFGQWFSASVGGNKAARERCNELGIREFAMSTDVNTAGGYLVPDEFKTDFIMNMEKYGALRQLLTPWPCPTGSALVPRITSGLTVYSPGQNTAITASDVAMDNVSLKTDTLGTLTYISNELLARSPIAVGNLVIQMIARAFAEKEDDMFLNGNGTSTYFGRTGLEAAIKALDPAYVYNTTLTNAANIASFVIASDEVWTSQTVGDFAAVVGRLPAYADNANTKWLCSKPYFANVMQRLAYAQGGATAQELIGGAQPRFMGYPVVISQKMTRVTSVLGATAGSVNCWLGDFSAGVAFGDSENYTVAQSEHIGFASNQLAIRGTEAIDFVVHGIGNYSATATSRQAGPIVGLINPLS